MEIVLLLLAITFELSAQTKPNILWISIDNLNDWVGYLKGHPQTKTPNIDHMIKRGISFTNVHWSTPKDGVKSEWPRTGRKNTYTTNGSLVTDEIL